MSHQGGKLFERLIAAPEAGESLEFFFHSSDAETDPQTVRFVSAPAVVSATVSVTPPEYSKGILTAEVQELGTGADGRDSNTPRMVAGSIVELKLQLNKPIPIPPANTTTNDQWIESTFAWQPNDPPPAFTLSGNSDKITLSWRAQASGVMAVNLLDDQGVRNTTDISFVFTVTQDGAPEVVLIEPSADESVLGSAVVPLLVRAHDDMGIDRIWIEVRRSSSTDDAWMTVTESGGGTELQTELEISTLSGSCFSTPVTVGDVLEVTARSTDHYQLGEKKHPAAQSVVRRLRIVSEQALVDEFRGILTALRQGAIRLDERQRTIQQSAATDPTQHKQGEVSERISGMRGTLTALDERRQMNHLTEESLASVLRQASDILEQAGAASNSARELSEALPLQEGAERERALAEVVATQEVVRDELEALASLLDRDEDTWVSTRRIEKLAETLESIARDRSALANKTAGADTSQLPADQAADLERVAQRAEQAATEAEELPTELLSSAERSRKDDPVRSESLKRAADKASTKGLATSANEAAQLTRENRMEEAQASSKSAEDVLQEMLDELKDEERSRALTLKRRLASMLEALKSLVLACESLESDVRAEEPRDASLALGSRLCQNIESVHQEALTLGRDGAQIAGALAQAVVASTTAAQAISSISSTDATPKETAVSALIETRRALNSAIVLAQKREDEVNKREEERQARQLAEIYRQIATKQEGIVAGIDAMVRSNDEQARKKLLESRRLGAAQEEVRTALSQVATNHEEVSKSKVMMKAHSGADGYMSEASSALREGVMQSAATAATRSLGLLRGLATAMSGSTGQDPFEAARPEGDSGGGGGGGSGGERPEIPPVAELKVLRALQQDIYDRTVAREISNNLALEQVFIQEMANELRERIEQPAESRGGSEPRPPTSNDGSRAGVAPAPQYFWQLAPDANTNPSSDNEPQAGLPSLDDVLGTGSDESGQSEATAAARATLERELAEMTDASQLVQLTDLMKRSAVLLSDGDRGLGVQRVQEDTLRRLDALIDSAQRRRQQGGGSGSSGSNSQKGEDSGDSSEESKRLKQQSKQQAADSAKGEKNDGTGDDPSDGPPPTDPVSSGPIDESQVEWGNLPTRDRDLVRQGLRERMSTMYRRATEAYYRNMAKGHTP